ncbi:hypothetical protein [Streptomyces sp. ME18-1-4]|uniref:hypothetical protein n=1 Tax=Streptomyces sp. ME18-1-4 TaxID=3028685 RepID=UPI0029B6D040|nr:hypothetical protein [Streptomyces sp. ME18-1-4]MDX3244481.1 hypothetical protein [Streptomyces sp. ME18-1-4]
MQEPQKPDGPEEPHEVELLSGPGDEEREHAHLRALWQRRSARGRAVIAATTVAVLALGGTVAYAATNGSDGGSPSASPSVSSSEGPGGRHGHGGPWFGMGGDAVHGEATVKDPDTGKWVVRVWQRGTVQKVNDDRVTVKSEDGTSWMWTVPSDTSVRSDGASSSGAGSLKKGDTVYVVGSRSGDTNTADRVLSGAFDDHGPGHRRGGFPGHGPWDRGEDRSPSPTGSGAAT